MSIARPDAEERACSGVIGCCTSRLGLIAVVVFALAACAAPVQHNALAPRHRLIGYVAGWQTAPKIASEKVTALNYAFAHIVRGRVVLDQVGAAVFLAQLRALKLHNPQLKILVSVGGWGADGFSDAAAGAQSRSTFAESAAQLVLDQRLDGIDLDWEYPGLPGPGIGHRNEDKRDFTLLLQTLRARLDALAREQHRDEAYLLTAALADGEFVAHVELGRIHRYLDWIDLMTYDFHNSLTRTTGHQSGLYRSATSAPNERSVDKAVQQFLAAGVPASKLVVGVPFYGRAFADVTPIDHGLDQPYGHYQGDFAWAQLVADFIGRNGYVRYWDDAAKEPYLWNAQARTFVSYDDPQSLALKAQFVTAHGLGGMMYWEQSQDPDGELLDILAGALK